MNWAFVDYENIGSLEALNIPDYERIFVFLGPKNSKLNVGTLPSNGFCRIELIGVTTVGSNNLDFCLAFHLGRFHEIAQKDVEFHIISNDTGFHGLVNHLNNLGRKCKKVAVKKSEPLTLKVPAPTKTTTLPTQKAKPPAKKASTKCETTLKLSHGATVVLARLAQLDGRTRPRKKASLVNWITSQCRGLTNGVAPDAICRELVNAKFIQESGTDIAYALERLAASQKS